MLLTIKYVIILKVLLKKKTLCRILVSTFKKNGSQCKNSKCLFKNLHEIHFENPTNHNSIRNKIVIFKLIYLSCHLSFT